MSLLYESIRVHVWVNAVHVSSYKFMQIHANSCDPEEIPIQRLKNTPKEA